MLTMFVRDAPTNKATPEESETPLRRRYKPNRLVIKEV
jgi:hypothetical protein